MCKDYKVVCIFQFFNLGRFVDGLAIQRGVEHGEELFEADGAALVPVHRADGDADHRNGVVVADGNLREKLMDDVWSMLILFGIRFDKT